MIVFWDNKHLKKRIENLFLKSLSQKEIPHPFPVAKHRREWSHLIGLPIVHSDLWSTCLVDYGHLKSYSLPIHETFGYCYPPKWALTDLYNNHLVTFQIATDYRSMQKSKLQRTFVSASDAAEDRARGVKREGGIIVDAPPKKNHKIQFVKPGQVNDTDAKSDNGNKEREEHTNAEIVNETKEKLKVAQKSTEQVPERIDYVKELSQIKCLDIGMFRYNMFMTRFGKLVLLVRPWTGKLWNIQCEYYLFI